MSQPNIDAELYQQMKDDHRDELIQEGLAERKEQERDLTVDFCEEHGLKPCYTCMEQEDERDNYLDKE